MDDGAHVVETSILEVYMNSVEFGKNLYGVEAAAQYYYGKSAKSLTREQAAF